MWNIIFATLAACSLCGARAHAESVELDFLAGKWAIFDANGAQIGESMIEIQAPEAMIYEVRRVGEGAAQPLWMARLERSQGWAQLFVSPAGVREFPALSTPGEWPLVMGAPTTLRNGSKVEFRLTMTKASDDESRRHLEMTRDGGASWSTVLDYTYRRAAEQKNH